MCHLKTVSLTRKKKMKGTAYLCRGVSLFPLSPLSFCSRLHHFVPFCILKCYFIPVNFLLPKINLLVIANRNAQNNGSSDLRNVVAFYSASTKIFVSFFEVFKETFLPKLIQT